MIACLALGRTPNFLKHSAENVSKFQSFFGNISVLPFEHIGITISVQAYGIKFLIKKFGLTIKKIASRKPENPILGRLNSNYMRSQSPNILLFRSNSNKYSATVAMPENNRTIRCALRLILMSVLFTLLNHLK